MRLRTLAPLHLGEPERVRRQRRYRRLAPPPLRPELIDLPAHPAVPRRLDDASACRASEEAVYAAAMATDVSTCDALLLDCVLDPALEALQRDMEVPVFGILRLSALHLASLGHRLAAVTRNRAIGDELERRIAAYGLSTAYLGTIVLDLDFAAVADPGAWNEALRRALGRSAAWGATALINGCSAVDLAESGSAPLLIDPTALALELVAAAAAAGRTPTPAGTARP